VRHACAAAVLLLAGCTPRPENAPAAQPNSLETRRALWAALQPLARARGIDPGFVYSLVAAESHFDPAAAKGDARGLMQLTPRAWAAVSDIPFRTGALEARTNLTVGIDSLASIKRALVKKGVFSYPLLWASYHYGLEFVEAHGFDMSRIPRPSDPISYRLFSGELDPVRPPD
jgi:soluble lytic murein transglycosylase-like protein